MCTNNAIRICIGYKQYVDRKQDIKYDEEKKFANELWSSIRCKFGFYRYWTKKNSQFKIKRNIIILYCVYNCANKSALIEREKKIKRLNNKYATSPIVVLLYYYLLHYCYNITI